MKVVETCPVRVRVRVRVGIDVGLCGCLVEGSSVGVSELLSGFLVHLPL